jgi:hypothetical protein
VKIEGTDVNRILFDVFFKFNSMRQDNDCDGMSAPFRRPVHQIKILLIKSPFTVYIIDNTVYRFSPEVF